MYHVFAAVDGMMGVARQLDGAKPVATTERPTPKAGGETAWKRATAEAATPQNCPRAAWMSDGSWIRRGWIVREFGPVDAAGSNTTEAAPCPRPVGEPPRATRPALRGVGAGHCQAGVAPPDQLTVRRRELVRALSLQHAFNELQANHRRRRRWHL